MLKARSSPRRAMRLWQALYPLGEDAGWSGEILSAEPLGERRRAGADQARPGKGATASRSSARSRLSDVVEGQRYAMRVEDDSLARCRLLGDYREDNSIARKRRRKPRHLAAHRPLSRAGLSWCSAFSRMRRELARLKEWAETGSFVRRGLFERPLTQVGFAVLSALILWPLFGLTPRRPDAGCRADRRRGAARARPHGGVPRDGPSQGAHDLHPAARRHRHRRTSL